MRTHTLAGAHAHTHTHFCEHGCTNRHTHTLVNIDAQCAHPSDSEDSRVHARTHAQAAQIGMPRTPTFLGPSASRGDAHARTHTHTWKPQTYTHVRAAHAGMPRTPTHLLRLFRVQGRGRARGLHSAESAAPGARVAHEHDGGCGTVPVFAPAPALANVGALGFLTHL